MTKRILELELVDFRPFSKEKFNFTAEIPLGEGGCNGMAIVPYDHLSVSGHNGAGKTTLREAIIFALLGRDSRGRVNPAHLIKRGTESSKVTLRMTGLDMTRSITDHGYGTTKLSTVPGKYFIQSQVRKIMCYDDELALCALVPGFFMSQTAEKKRSLIAKAFPQTLREKLFLDAVELDPQWISQRFGPLEDGIPQVAAITKARQSLDKVLDKAENRVAKLEEAINRQIEEVTLDPEIVFLKEAIQKENENIKEYQNILTMYFEKKSLYEDLQKERDRWIALKESLVNELNGLVDLPLPEIDWGPYTRIKEKLKVYPSKPQCLDLPKSDRCPRCGQVIGIGHREQLQEENEQAKLAWQKEMEETEKYNEGIQKVVDPMYVSMRNKEDELQRALATNSMNKTRREAISKQLLEISIPSLPEAPVMPQPPVRKFSEEDFKKNNAVIEWHFRRLGVMEHYKAEKEKALLLIEDARLELSVTREEFLPLTRLESVVKLFPTIEYHARKKLLEIPLEGLSLVEGADSVEFSYQGVPYDLLSTGERMRVDIAICKKFHSICQAVEHCKLPGVIFIDNADMMDWAKDYVGEDFQLFTTYVDPSPLTVSGRFFKDPTIYL